MSTRDRAGALFAAAFGEAPAVVWAAPGRVNLIGEHTDYNDGFVLPFALPHTTVAAVAATGTPEWTVVSELAPDAPVTFTEAGLAPGAVEGWAAYAAGIVWALRDAGHAVGGARIALASDVPIGAGLSSSAALECAVLGALADLHGLDVPTADRPALARRAENVYVGAPTGILDQSASIRCAEGHALFLDCRTYEAEQVPFPLADNGLSVLIIDTRAPHRHVDGEYAARRASCEEAAALLGVPALRDVTDLNAALSTLDDELLRRRVRHVVTENTRVLDTVASLRSGLDPVRLGALLSASHASMRDDYEITVGEVDLAAATAEKAGAHGARMTGGGFGGCVIALCETEKTGEIGEAVAEAFAAAGYTAPVTFVATPSAGAHRLA
ncbi:galactokinase [Actinorhabdospora filicis]|uniref:galactokinase n=1 Tax=Actinorhabdospora filicis TaxID=1785913 RepID=UPI002555D1C5|nr:galactokinase [Actinorhabdospora filicis]